MNALEQPCPCCSGALLKACCMPVIEQDSAASAEQLMRSRYTAFVLHDADYLLKTWHEDTRPEDFSLGKSRWLGLKICEANSDTVCFEAAFDASGKGMVLKETSRFVCLKDGRWRYLDGDCKVQTIPRNGACFCGSAVKYKRCCGKPQ